MFVSMWQDFIHSQEYRIYRSIAEFIIIPKCQSNKQVKFGKVVSTDVL
jgi:hypothetical protein